MRILLADDHDLVRETIAAFLRHEGLGEVVTAGSLSEAVELTRKASGFDLVLLDLVMPGMQGLEGLARMVEVNQGRPVALLSGSASSQTVERALGLGAAGFVPKTLGAQAMMAAVRLMAAGEVFVPYGLTASSALDRDTSLNAREMDVLRGICAGKPNKGIAADLGLQEATVKLYAKSLNRKLGARNRAHAAMIGRDRGLV
ncbi:response regulator [Rubellimicrobium roseum]|uniref:Response regulator transcription factor n=1 Tax=Rubellimicrobium roseum TaxID=687525 RepID=A0A5C4N594_9RHOB|nr:response regulator transcription factor [Rubellimicrobium roseum]TNC61404.1 response regulator transcription factor [Rubellimicrobium roseum]